MAQMSTTGHLRECGNEWFQGSKESQGFPSLAPIKSQSRRRR